MFLISGNLFGFAPGGGGRAVFTPAAAAYAFSFFLIAHHFNNNGRDARENKQPDNYGAEI